MQTRVEQWRNWDTPMTYDASMIAVSNFSAVKCGFYGLERKAGWDPRVVIIMVVIAMALVICLSRWVKASNRDRTFHRAMKKWLRQGGV